MSASLTRKVFVAIAEELRASKPDEVTMQEGWRKAVLATAVALQRETGRRASGEYIFDWERFMRAAGRWE